MTERPSLIERAFQLAETGNYKTVTEIKLALRAENYAGVDSHLSGRSLRDQLRLRMHAAPAKTVADQAVQR
jgi:hypothetical protein